MMDDISVHVFKGVKLMDIYDKTTGFPRLDEELRKYEVSIDKDNIDKDMARERNKEIELEVENLREMLNYNGVKLKPKRVEEINEEIRKLLTERDDNTFKYGLAGKAFERFYFKKTDGADRDGDVILPGEVRFPEVNGETRFRFITEEMVTLYSKKNADYGDAFTQSLDEDGLLVSKIRIKDKLNRFSQLISNDALVNDESMRDTLIDLANYTVMTLMWLDENG